MEKDGSNHLYIDIDNVRITYVPSKDRDKSADWAGSDVIRIQAYKGAGQSLHMGAELPVKSPRVFVKLIAGLCAVYDEGKGNP